MSEKSKKALMNGGSSHTWLARLIQDMMDNMSLLYRHKYYMSGRVDPLVTRIPSTDGSVSKAWTEDPLVNKTSKHR
ncbi:unnamed protein product [Dovyalis caffra]|uniref:Uncharacterized protein n=1 Tax=Dovyalis caffra TaxID=77055 RepID=A0AAV1S4W6_9ROSI|nr:unnamed protein product [Dovyalis caffra]